MSRWQLILLGVLSALPLAVFAGFGAWSLYESGRWFWIWWTLPVCWGLSSLLWRWWGRPIDLPLPDLGQTHWTPQDQAAWAIVEAEQKRLSDIQPDELVDPQFYTRVVQELSLKIAQHYHPRASDPLGSLSVVEILAAADLLTEDMEELFLKYVPGSHFVTVSQWRMLTKAPAWWQSASNAAWVVSIAMNPLNIGRYLASRFAIGPLTQQLQQNLLGGFYTAFVQRAGHYLIELNSGRLRGGSKRYREIMGRLSGDAGPVTDPPDAPAPLEAVTITLAVIGQVKAGKSSLVNSLLGKQQAVVDVLPATMHVRRHRLEWPERSEMLVLLDTSGYSDAGASEQQRQETRDAVRQADVVLLVLDARSPARDADVAALDDLQRWFTTQPRQKPPAIIAVLNKVDGLSPVLEWAPPYNWRQPVRPKEKTIAAAVEYAREVFGTRIVDVIPTCTDVEHDRVSGVDEELLPAIERQLSTARAVALLKTLHAGHDRGKVRQVLGQVVEAGKQLVETYRQP